MYRDKTLIPTEAIRLCALGSLADGPRSYPELASAVRHFASRIMGPSLDILGTSIELLRLEGLIEPEADANAPDDAHLRITEAGRAELMTLMKSRVRSPLDDLNKLVTALKMRFFHLLSRAERCEQLDLLIEATEGEINRLTDLRANNAQGLLARWLDHDIAQLEARKRWFESRKLETECREPARGSRPA
jgi:DNA-binding PadR family transcriptional regulator